MKLTKAKRCFVTLADGRVLSVNIDETTTGDFLLKEMCRELGGAQRPDHFGFRIGDTERNLHWLHPHEPVLNRLQNSPSPQLLFQVQNYPVDPLEIHSSQLRHLLFLQLRRDLANGNLIGTAEELFTLAAYAVLADEDFSDKSENYIRKLQLRPDNQLLPFFDAYVEERITSIVSRHRNVTREQAEITFLKLATTAPSYGIEPFHVKDQKQVRIVVGVNFHGLSVFTNSIRTNLFAWPTINKVYISRKMLLCSVLLNKSDITVGFTCSTRSDVNRLCAAVKAAKAFFL